MKTLHHGHNCCVLPTPIADFEMLNTGDDTVRLIALGSPRDLRGTPLIRIHSSCMASEVFGALDCDCADQLRTAMRMIAQEGAGLIIHLDQEGRGHGLSVKITATNHMQRNGVDTVTSFKRLGLEPDVRSYESAVEILNRYEIRQLRLISNNPAKAEFLRRHGIAVELVHAAPVIREENIDYLISKRDIMGHEILLEAPTVSPNEVPFYHSNENFGWLSNFSPDAIYIRNRIWPTVEHFYQAQKFAGTEHEEIIRILPSPTRAKRYAQEHNDMIRHDWSELREGVMLDGLRAKFSQHPHLASLLVETSHCRLIERAPDNNFWGVDHDGHGHNRLGELLMLVRSEIQASQPTTSGST